MDLLQQRVQQQPRQNAYTFLVDGENQAVSLTYEQLDRRACAIAGWLQSLYATGERVLLLYPPGLEFITAFWGCLYAGAIAVPAYPPHQNRSLDRLLSIAGDAQSSLALTTSALLVKIDAFTAQCPNLNKLRWLATDAVADDVAQHWRRPAIAGDDLAFLQYTSGSTSTPKGVMVTHGNLLSNEKMIKQAFGQSEQSLIVGWLPLYHDMGLIGNVLQPIYVGAQCVLMSPVSFLQDPYRWLAAISRYRATTSGGPNFAYDLCVRKIGPEQRESLDLSSWEVAFNGAEPVRAETMAAFARTFEPCGFRMSAFRPCYGLAEATLLVTTDYAPQVKTVDPAALQKNVAVEVANGALLVSCGRPSSGQTLRICRPETLDECLPGEVGEICVSGPNITKGYWKSAEQTARAFYSRNGETVLRSGDLGVLLGGNLFVTGRLKDLIIIRGRNHYPHDIERTVEQSHPALRAGGGAAFAVEVEGEERLVIAQELNRRKQVDHDEIIRAISEAVVAEHELQVHAVVLLRTASIPKTSSGKIQRHACRAKFLTQSFDVVAEWKALPQRENEETDLQAWLRAELAAKRGVSIDEINVNRSITDYKLDSLEAIDVTHRIEAKFGVVLSMASLLQGPTIAELAAQAQSTAETTTVAVPARSEFPLSHGQRALWFLYQLAPESPAYNIATTLRIVSSLDVAALRRAFQVLLDRHPSLRTVFHVQQDEPVQRIMDHAEISFTENDASRWSEQTLNEQLVEEAHRPFDLHHGPVLRVHLYSRAENDHVVLLVVHHIVADFWSLAVLANELSIAYASELSGAPAQLPPNTDQYSDYVERQQVMLNGANGEQLWSYWQKQLAGELPVPDLPSDHPRPAVQTFKGAATAFKLSAEVTRGLTQLARAHGATLYTVLLTAFQTLLFRYTGQEDLLVGSPTAGRNQNGLAGLVGYFVNPIVLRSNPSASTAFTSFLEQTKQTVLEAFAHQDFPFSLLVERLQPERDSSRSPLFQAMFILQKAHQLDREGLTSFTLGEAGARIKLGALEVESMALDQRISQFDLTLVMAEEGGALSGSLQFNTDLFYAATIERMVEHFKTLLEGIRGRPPSSACRLRSRPRRDPPDC
jgi:acyl-CoA synthetase (AMP-forming)/AMP-acid ligase II/acyl carrier protein